MNMTRVLRCAVEALPQLLMDQDRWQSLHVDYHPPVVNRLWTPFESAVLPDQYRIYLHEILPCSPKDALFHPHPWPSAMVLCDVAPDHGYEMGLGFGDPAGPAPPVMGPFWMPSGSVYQMERPDEWHYVAPIKRRCMTIMVTGPKFPEFPAGEKKNLRELTRDEFLGLYLYFCNISVQSFALRSVIWADGNGNN